jgi:predicted nucleotide-binding protein
VTDDSKDWINAREALRLLKPVAGGEYSAQMTICARAKDGLIRSRSARCILYTRSVRRSEVVVSQTPFGDFEIPAEWWWAACKNPARSNWSVGDLELGAEDGTTSKAYAVQFLRADIMKMVPASSNAPQEHEVQTAKPRSEKIFIGHGHSLVWRELKDFIVDELKLPYDEFNAQSAAGIPNAVRLKTMLDDAAFAFLVLTAEDRLDTGAMQARMNVVHEAGLFQARLGFDKAILLLEDGCEEFSNIHGLGYVPFPPGKIKYTFEEVRRVLRREKLVS